MQVLDVPFRAGEQIISAQHFMAFGEQAINQMRSKKPGTTGDQDALTATVDACQICSPKN
jgi:hypothetical protein